MQRDGATAWHLASAQAKAFALAALVAITVFALLLEHVPPELTR